MGRAAAVSSPQKKAYKAHDRRKVGINMPQHTTKSKKPATRKKIFVVL
jgi:hypothetical protein